MIIERILNGETCALVSDAGMPIISDPGEDLTKLCYENNIEVCAVPGPSALITALAISGMPSKRFSFEGFLPVEKSARREHISWLIGETRTMIFYESPYRVLKSLTQFAETFGAERQAATVREISKLHEECLRGTLAELIEHFKKNEPRGEFVIVVAGADGAAQPENDD